MNIYFSCLSAYLWPIKGGSGLDVVSIERERRWPSTLTGQSVTLSCALSNLSFTLTLTQLYQQPTQTQLKKERSLISDAVKGRVLFFLAWTLTLTFLVFSVQRLELPLTPQHFHTFSTTFIVFRCDWLWRALRVEEYSSSFFIIGRAHSMNFLTNSNHSILMVIASTQNKRALIHQREYSILNP